jgi:hypothetical protein
MYKYKLHWKRQLYMHKFTNLGFPTLLESSSWHRKLNGSAIFHLSVDWQWYWWKTVLGEVRRTQPVTGEKGKGTNFFSFPKDGNLRKVWTHYCKRWNFAPVPSHRLCSAHFSKDSFPSIPLTVNREVKDGRPIQLPMPRRAFEKRRKAEVSKFMHI